MMVILCGGGTGGHLIPGIALAEELVERGVDVFFLVTRRSFDRTQLSKRKFNFAILPSPQIPHCLSNQIIFPVALISAIMKSILLLKKCRPKIVIGLGGYGSFPPLVAAKVLHIPYLILEQNIIPGKVSRLVSRWAVRIYSQWNKPCGFSHMSAHKIVFSGSPLRKSMVIINKEKAKRFLGLREDKLTLTVMGGSQGAEKINQFLISEINYLEKLNSQLQILHLTGLRDRDIVSLAYKSKNILTKVIGFTDKMEYVYSASDIIISRGGAMSINEVAFYKLPAIFIPYPYASDNHQLANVRELEKIGAAKILEEKYLTNGAIYNIIKNWLSNREILLSISGKMCRFSKSDARCFIVNDILKFLM